MAISVGDRCRNGFGPSIVTTATFLSGRFDDALEGIRNRRGARPIAERLSPAVNAIRFGGLVVAWVGCWLHRAAQRSIAALSLAAGVTTIRTTGTIDSVADARTRA
jgi:hypothetical protein